MIVPRTLQRRATVLACASVLLALLFTLVGCDSSSKPAQRASDSSPSSQAEQSQAQNQSAENRATATPEGQDIVIPISEITDTARFYPTQVNDTDLEVLAVRAPDGSIRTAFNTCQVCYDSGKGYYIQEASVLVCQNCGNRFAMDDVEIVSGGCNPVPIFDKNKTVTDSEILIPASFLKESEKIFRNWKTAA